ncbi:MAG: RNA polymerase sigma factor [Candidatus Hydrogenedentota bacterium]
MNELDGSLLDRWETAGHNQAFMELVARYQGMVYGVCLRIVRDSSKAEDLVQECFLKLTRSRPKGRDSLGPWLHRVATTAINEQRSAIRRATRETKYMEGRPGHEVAAWDDINEILDAELNALPDACRAVIVAHYSEGHTQVEVAERMVC